MLNNAIFMRLYADQRNHQFEEIKTQDEADV